MCFFSHKIKKFLYRKKNEFLANIAKKIIEIKNENEKDFDLMNDMDKGNY